MDFIHVDTYSNYIEANIISGRLESEGINCWLKDENTVTIDPLLTNAIGGIKLMVASSQVERAMELLREFKHEKQSSHPCPKCSSINVEFVTTPRKASNWFGVLFGALLTSFALSNSKVYHCFNCGNEFK
jgi:hypothetical protein